MKNILIADDHAIARLGLKNFIENILSHCVIDEAMNGGSALEKIKEKDYHIIVLDVNMPETDSTKLISEILTLKPASKILMFSMNPEDIYAKKYLQLGVWGFLNKTTSVKEIRTAILNILNNKKYVSENLKNLFADEAIGNRKANPFDELSAREFEILPYLIKGHSVGEISKLFNLHTSTAGTHKASILKKLNCKNVVDINRLATVQPLQNVPGNK